MSVRLMIPGAARTALLLVLLLLAGRGVCAAAPPAEQWVGTWAAAPEAMPNAASSGAAHGYGAAEMTLREIVHVSLGGSTVRVVFTNEFGREPLTIMAAGAAISEGGSSVNLVDVASLTFDGKSSITISAGALAVSDGVAMKLPAGADLAVSFVVPAQPLHVVSQHDFANQTSYVAPGNVVGAKMFETARKITAWPFLKGVDVRVTGDAGAVAALGDSITDGAESTMDANARWTDVLAQRLGKNKRTEAVGVLNEGINGNRVLHDGIGPRALARFDRDVLAQAGVRWVVILEGINDIGHGTDPIRPYDPVSEEELVAGYTQMIERAHVRGIRVIGGTLLPFAGSKYDSAAGETMREAVNAWIRTTPLLDGVIDFDKAVADPQNPRRLNPKYDSGDHLHPKDAGYAAMGDAVDLNLFATKN